MALYGAFSSSMLGMMSQARSLHNISTNIANVNTGGFKRTNTEFSTVLSRSVGTSTSDNGGVRPKDISTVTQQGIIVASENATDVAISGKGFFVMNTKQDGTGESVYGRDGSFQVQSVNDITVPGIGASTVTTKDGYLADKNGNFVQGWAYANNAVSTAGTPTSLRVDQFAFVNKFDATTKGNLNLNLPAGDAVGKINQYDISIIDSLGAKQSVKLNFSKTGTNAWNVTNTTSQTPVAQVDSVTFAAPTIEAGDVYSVTANGNSVSYTTLGTEADINAIRDALISKINTDPQMSTKVTATAGAAGAITLTSVTAGNALTTTATATNGGATADNGTPVVATTTLNTLNTVTSAATAITFNADGTVNTPTSLNLALTFNGGSTGTIALDIKNMTQFYGDFLPVSYTKNGYGKASMTSFNFDSSGNIVGNFEDNSFRNIYKLSLGVFSNPDSLEAINGNVYKPTADSGAATVTSVGSNGYASFSPNSRELSNVDIADEFSKMMRTQTAYNASSTVFKTADEMTTVARDLKR